MKFPGGEGSKSPTNSSQTLNHRYTDGAAWERTMEYLMMHPEKVDEMNRIIRRLDEAMKTQDETVKALDEATTTVTAKCAARMDAQIEIEPGWMGIEAATRKEESAIKELESALKEIKSALKEAEAA